MEIFKKVNKTLIFILFLLNIACEKEVEYKALSGQLIGYVTLYDSQWNKLSDKSGVEVIADGSNPQIKATTDENGQFIIDNLKSGTYNIVFNKEGYCQHKIVSYQFVGGNKPATIYQTANILPSTPIYRMPSFQIDSLEIINLKRYHTVEFMVTAKVSDQGDKYTQCRFYLSNEPNISYINYISTDYATNNSVNKSMSFSFHIDTLKFPVGSELYFIMYPASERLQNYIDIISGNKVYTSIDSNKPSEIVKITIPEVTAL